MKVLVQVGERNAARVAAEVPGVEVETIPSSGEIDPAVRGEVLLADPLAAATLPDLLDRGVRWVHVAGTGIDRAPLALLRERGPLVTCSRGASAVPIAEFVLAAMLAFEKGFPGTWLSEPPEQWGWTRLGGLRGRTVGLVGLGGIGAEVARLALAFGCRVVAVRRHPEAGSPVSGVEVVGDLAAVLPEADHLVLAAPATDRTRRLLDADALARVKPGVHVVNIARGSLVDQDALVAALDDGRVAMATLDVTDPEPLPAGHPLYAHPKVRVSAHVSWSAPGAFRLVVDLFVEELRRYVAGEPLTLLVDLDEGY